MPEDKQKMWLVGQTLGHHEGKSLWEFNGIFDDQKMAEAACTTPFHFVGPCELNADYGELSTEWPGAYYPRLKAEAVAGNMEGEE